MQAFCVVCPLFLLSECSKFMWSVWYAKSWIQISALLLFTVRRLLSSFSYWLPKKLVSFLRKISWKEKLFVALCHCPQISLCNSTNENNSQCNACLSFLTMCISYLCRSSYSAFKLPLLKHRALGRPGVTEKTFLLSSILSSEQSSLIYTCIYIVTYRWMHI